MSDNIYSILSDPNKVNIARASEHINNGEVIIFPTETVYGIGADATNTDAVAKIYDIKKRPNYNPLITHVHNLEQAQKYGVFNDIALKLAHEFWQGGLTLVVPQIPNSTISPLVTAGLSTIALRVPDSNIALEIIRQSNKPICAPSANMFQTLSTTDAEHVIDNLGDAINGVSRIIDGGECSNGLESTIVGCYDDNVTLLRKGAITKQQIESVINLKITTKTTYKTSPISSGQLKKHYSPKSNLRINVKHINDGELLLAFGKIDKQSHFAEFAGLNLSPTGDLQEAAKNFFAYMNILDAMIDGDSRKSIAVMPIANTGIGEAINDKLKRAVYK